MSSLVHDGLTYTTSESTVDNAVHIACADASGTVRWAHDVIGGVVVILQSELRVDGDAVVLWFGGLHEKGGEAVERTILFSRTGGITYVGPKAP